VHQKTYPNKIKRREIMQSVFSNSSGIKTEINYIKRGGKSQSI
jgi:hypothetical protein